VKVIVVLGGKHLAVSVTKVPIGPELGFRVSEGAQAGWPAEVVLVVVSGTTIVDVVLGGTVESGSVVEGASLFPQTEVVGRVSLVSVVAGKTAPVVDVA
jgi:hypothetical protein